ncbi:MAG: RNA polymerase sigma factor [Bacteroidetes bacterium]|nr:RNA polymerase sigma factor [Bacteroidota bacterium]
MNVLSPSISIGETAETKVTKGLTPEVSLMVQGCLENNRAAQEQLYRKYYGRMMGTCMRYLGNEDEAREVLNTGFLKVFQNLHSFLGESNLEGWIYRIIRNAIIDKIRSRVKFREESLTEVLEDTVGVNANALQELYAKDLLKMLHDLPDTTRLVFNMYAIEGFKHEEIAKVLSISSGTSKWHVSEARRILKQKLEHKSEKS